MIKINRRNSFLRPLLVTALPFGLLAAGAMSAHAGAVTVTGANGANAVTYHLPGGGGSARAMTATPSDPSNTATATGGNGGSASYCVTGCVGWQGGPGGAAYSTATTSIGSGAASAEATSFGGHGGGGGGGGAGTLPGPGGNGGAANSSAAASSAKGPASATASSTGGNAGGGLFAPIAGRSNAGGGATAAASATSGTTGSASATASSTGGADGYHDGGASAAASARDSDGAAITSASAPTTHDGSSETALTRAMVTGAGSSPPTLVNITAGRAVSNAILTASGPDIGVGAMSAALGGASQAATYEATATFDFTTSKGESLDLKLLSGSFADTSAGIAFDSLDLQVLVDGGAPHVYPFSSLTGSSGAEKFFDADLVRLGSIAAGSQSIEIEYVLGYKSSTSAAPGDGFGFTYALVDPPRSAAVPEPSTWAMMLVGFASLAFAGYRGSRKGTAFAA